MHEVHTRGCSQSRGVIVIAMDGEDRQPDVEVLGLVVDKLVLAVSKVHQGVGEVFNLDRIVTFEECQ